MTEPAPSFSTLKIISDVYYGCWPNKPKYLPDDYPDLTGKTALVTGSNQGIGYKAICLLFSKNCNIIAVVRTTSNGEKARDQILKDFPLSKGKISVIGGNDYNDLATIKPVAHQIKTVLGNDPLNIIIHNAGIMPNENKGTTVQGHEDIFQVNTMAPQLLQSYLDPLFLKKDDSLKRVVWVSSAGHLFAFPKYGINWENPSFKGIPIDERPFVSQSYGQSKAGNILQAKAWATTNKQAVDEIGCVSVSCYPGNFGTNIQKDWPWLLRNAIKLACTDTIYGAYTELYSALSPELTTSSQGAYILPFGEVGLPREDIQAALQNGTDLKFWELVDSLIENYK
ncbi:hypothetical protein TBLA_0B06720 [Henningerozyma blattae CBS 6284]|uniref:Ketoreductase (KR) domain-containing protein n=1 Tax=Henningerozyma blattae (strain ATCC 34711 / CBS 6284 / DSM 70876 / NBRC 10599 / NRRL Y-10934 / UCD 77-7) TaxID=1071380 RepID=I2GZE2_HENB6|nr:hypothetical protein TBLA_0B06720 [Tetrapisispora blattae CBS 6284]CCH59494.1 hypothetical protein TBLA_0B06720 [Tetrapisispora blattae CBS 6284]